MKWNSVLIETWRDIMEWNAMLYPDKVAFHEVATDREWTFQQHNEVVNMLCNALFDLGLEKGDRVAVLSGDLIEYCQIAMICKAGLVYVPINWRLTGPEAAHIVNESGAKALFIDKDHVDIARSINKDIPEVKHFICINASPGDMMNYNDFIASASPEDPGVDVEETDILGIPYTSGTAAFPKGVVRTHADVLVIDRLQVRDPRYRHDDIYLGALPLFHVAMLNLQFALYMIGATQRIMRFEPKAIMEAIQKYKVTVWQGVPTMVISVMDHPDRPRYDLSTLRVVIYVGSPMPSGAARRAWKTFGPILFQVYGATEGGGTILIPEDHAKAFEDPSKEYILNSAGKPITGSELKIVDDNDNEVPLGTMGEVCFRTKKMVTQYLKKPEEKY